MQKLYQRQQRQYQSQRQSTQKQYQRILKQYINHNQSLKVTLDYCLKQYNSFTERQPIIATFEQYSPKQISKLLLRPQLNEIKTYFNKFSNQECKLEHFLLILIQVMTVPFQQVPKYLIGIMEIFKQISSNSQTVSYNAFFNYVIGQVATLHQEEQNTQFQIHFEQLKKQDYLLHDNGIRKIYYAKDMKLYLVLDENSQVIKIYNLDMKIITRYQPAKDKHNNRSPKITYFDYNQFSNKLGIAYSDCTIELINLCNFLNRPREQFEKLYLSYQIWHTDEVFILLEFIQMTNKWLTLTQSNQIMVYDLQKPKESTDDFVTYISLWNEPKDELKITDVLEIVPLSLMCIVAGNEIFFFNQKLTQRKYKNYKHGNNIKLVKFCEQKNSFYILAEQKHLTILTVQRNSSNFKLSSYPLNHIVKDFEIFPQLDTILMTDNEHYVFLYDLRNLFCYQATLYSHIAKKTHRYIRILRTSKCEFLIFQSYMLSMVQEKVALEKEVQYNIDPEAFYDEVKEELYLSINNQILNFNILRRELIKSYNQENHHLPKTFSNYLIDENNQILTLDSQINLSHLQKKQKDGKLPVSISKNFDTQEPKMIKYNKHKQLIYLLGRDELFEVKNNKSLNTLRQLIFHDFDFFSSWSYCQQSNSLLLSTQNHQLYLLRLDDLSMDKKIDMKFPKDKSILEEVKCIKCHYVHSYDMIVLLTNNNLLYIISVSNPEQHYYLKLLEGVVYAQVDIDFKFVKMVVEEVTLKDNVINDSSSFSTNHKTKGTTSNSQVYVMVATEDGHFLKLDITSHIIKLHQQSNISKKQSNPLTNNPTHTKHIAAQTNKSKYLLNSNSIPSQKCPLNPQNYIRLSRNQCQFSKRHEKQIVVMKIIYLQKYLTLTIAKDGQIKLSQNSNKTICITRLPNLAKKQWNTQDIEKIKINKIIQHIKQVINQILEHLQHKKSPKQILQKMKKTKQAHQDLRKFNHQEPIPIQIETKKIQDIVKKQVVFENPQTFSDQLLINTSPSFRMHKRFMSNHKIQQASKTFAHPWREKKSFVEMYSNLPSDNKYGKKIPNELKHLRRSLDMIPKQNKLPVQKLDVKIIPQISSYKFEEKIIINVNPEETSEILNNKKENFESCYYVKSRRKARKSNINDFDEIDKEFYKKQVSFGKRYIPKKDEKKEEEYLETQLSKTLNFKKNKRAQMVMDYNMMPHKSNPIGSILELFQKHNKEVAGTRHGRQIRISKELTSMKNKSFDTRY